MILLSIQHKRIIITRSRRQSEKFKQLLLQCGALPLEYPCLATQFIFHSNFSLEALSKIKVEYFDWLIILSQNAACGFFSLLNQEQIELSDKIKIAAVGNKSAEYVRALGYDVQLIPMQFTSDSLATESAFFGKKILLPTGNLNDGSLSKNLQASGAEVCTLEVYQTICGDGGINFLQAVLKKEIDVITFHSSSAVQNFVKRFSLEGGHLHMLAKIPIACVGPSTAQSAKNFGLNVQMVARIHNDEGLIQVLKEYFS